MKTEIVKLFFNGNQTPITGCWISPFKADDTVMYNFQRIEPIPYPTTAYKATTLVHVYENSIAYFEKVLTAQDEHFPYEKPSGFDSLDELKKWKERQKR